MSSRPDPARIEADLAEDRASLASALDELSDRVSPEALARDALGAFRNNASAYTRSIDEAVRSNPLAVAITAAGLAWLIFGSKKTAHGSHELDGQDTYQPEPYGSGRSGYGVGSEGYYSGASGRLPSGYRSGEASGSSGSSYGSGSSGYRSGANPGGGYQGGAYGSGGSHGYDSDDSDSGWAAELDKLRHKAMDALHRLESEAKSYYSDMRDGLSDRYASARDFAGERSSVIADFTRDMQGKLSHGLEDMSDAARERIVAAREKAYAARIRAQRMGRRAISDPTRMIEEHPIAAGAVALAFGAALGAALPRTRTEDRYFGEESDRLMHEAASMFRAERDRAMKVAQDLGDDLKEVASEAAEQVSQKAEEAVGTIATKAGEATERAKSRVEAETKSTGKSSYS
jgi:ElaB/YqjD/DUF883 family membrane-anchored ribosome-binding protein